MKKNLTSFLKTTLPLMVLFTGVLSFFGNTTQAQCNVQAYASTLVNGAQNWTGQLGARFTVNTPITITRLGAFDHQQDGLLRTITVGINRVSDGAIMVGPIVMSGGADALVGSFRMRAVAPVVLAAGDYTVIAVGYGSVGTTELNGNTNIAGPPPTTLNSGAGSITFVQSNYNTTTTYTTGTPVSVYAPPGGFHAGTFEFAPVTTPTITWNGTGGSNWSTPTSWTPNFVPTDCYNVAIPAGATPYPILSTTSSVKNMFIDAGASVDLNGKAFTIKGTVTGLGGIKTAPNSDLTITGAITSLNFDQTSSATRTLRNFVLDGGSAVTLGNPLEIAAGIIPGTMIVNNLSTLNTGGFLTLKSDDNGTARVGSSAGTIIGDVTVERNIKNPGKRAWHLLSGVTTSTTQSIKQAWQENGTTPGAAPANEGTLITSNLYTAGNGFDMWSNTSSILTHNQAGGGSWNYNLGNTNLTELDAYQGYMLFVRGDRNHMPGAYDYSVNRTVLRAKGALRQGTQTAVTIAAAGGGRTLVGNPFASPIDFEKIYTTPNLSQEFYMWDPTLGGAFGLGAYVLVERTGGGTYQSTPFMAGQASLRYIHSGQAIFLQATGSDASLVFDENSKAAATPVINPIVATTEDQQILTQLMEVVQVNNTLLLDGMRVRFGDTYQAGLADDITKFNNWNENISSFRNGKRLIVERRPMIVSTDTIFLRMTNLGIKNYRLQISTQDFVQTNTVAYLQDTYLNTVTSLDLTGTEKNIDFSVTSNPASANQDRFRIIFALNGPLPVTISSVKAAQQGSNIAVEWKVSNQLNMKQYEVEKSTDGVNYSKVATQAATGTNGSEAVYNWLDVNPVTGNNFYRIRTVGLSGDTKTSNVVIVKIGKGDAGISVYPNPVINSTMGVQFAGMDKGIYQLRLVNAAGQVVFTKSVNHAGGSAAQTVPLDISIAKGYYHLEIVNPDNTKTIKSLLISE